MCVSGCDPQNGLCFKNFIPFLLFTCTNLSLLLFVSVIHGRPRRQLRCRPELFLAKVRLMGAEIAQHLFERESHRAVVRSRHVRDAVAGLSYGGARNDIFEAHYLVSL